jgi:hypothetical protein
MRRHPLTWFAVAATALLPACGVQTMDGQRGPSASGETARVALVDSLPWSSEMSEGVLRRVEVRTSAGTDTIDGVRTATPPVAVPGAVLGFAYDEDRVTHGWIYELRNGRTRTIHLNADVHPFFSAPALSPDGEHVAYVVVPGNGTATPIVRRWPERRLLQRGLPVAIVPGDASFAEARWTDANTYEIRIHVDGGRIHRVRGTVVPRTMRADTVPAS